MILLIDNYDSFTYNLYQLFRVLGEEILILRNDKVDTNRILELSPRMIVLSPGPGGPDAAGNCIDIVQRCAGKLPVFGICLGMQVIAQAFGAKVVRAIEPVHGKVGLVEHDGSELFRGLPCPFEVTRYHSLVVERSTLPSCFEVSAWSTEDEIMGVVHKELPLFGVQFHPEAWLTVGGKEIARSALDLAKVALR